ncbi:hypothetical protein OS493_031691 [Desmophyllum pertusum]|uniref:Uncharacterized protein n=1 Tax=Desmophyllum pertusum TaxID=174260 RepID=A0A9W9ZX12_9CNID|nr:hypothetical protein OS493_031691 [Desmophyllum pertusum]
MAAKHGEEPARCPSALAHQVYHYLDGQHGCIVLDNQSCKGVNGKCLRVTEPWEQRGNHCKDGERKLAYWPNWLFDEKQWPQQPKLKCSRVADEECKPTPEAILHTQEGKPR